MKFKGVTIYFRYSLTCDGIQCCLAVDSAIFGCDCSRASIDASSVPAKGGDAIGPNPTDRGKPGTAGPRDRHHRRDGADIRNPS